MKKIELKNRKKMKIVGNLEIPNQTPRGVCIVQHGYSGFKEQKHVAAMKDAFLEQGFITFNFDTTNSFGESDGKLEDSRIGLHAEDLEDVVEWAKQQYWFVEPLALTGTSMGGYSVLAYAEKYPDEISYCVPVAPVVSGDLIHESNRERNPEGYEQWKKTGWLEKESSSKPGVIKRSPWDLMIEYMNHDLLPKANRLTMPMLLIGGSEDTSIPIKHLDVLFDAMPDGNKTFEVLEGLPHTPKEDRQLKLLKETIKNWLEKSATDHIKKENTKIQTFQKTFGVGSRFFGNYYLDSPAAEDLLVGKEDLARKIRHLWLYFEALQPIRDNVGKKVDLPDLSSLQANNLWYGNMLVILIGFMQQIFPPEVQYKECGCPKRPRTQAMFVDTLECLPESEKVDLLMFYKSNQDKPKIKSFTDVAKDIYEDRNYFAHEHEKLNAPSYMGLDSKESAEPGNEDFGVLYINKKPEEILLKVVKAIFIRLGVSSDEIRLLVFKKPESMVDLM